MATTAFSSTSTTQKAPSGTTSTSSVSQPAIAVLDWSARFQIMLGKAKAINFVPENRNCAEEFKVHGRIHLENILLTENYDPNLADYGFSRPHSARDHTMLRTISVATAAGKYEYMLPDGGPLIGLSQIN
ncbi:unnamed protein product [Calypogeia fissa]